ncbi:MAG TPA: sulfotransferase [Oscillatoriaceae cyanobacterium]
MVRVPYDFTAPAQLREDLDRPFLETLPPAKPLVFVLGLHRSGTTYLTQLLADRFAVASPQVYHVTHYRRLLAARHEGLERRYQDALAAALTAEGIANRGIDAFPVGPTNLEEYAFILRKFGGDWGFTARSAPVFEELTRKLSALEPEAAALLLKNPHDLIRIEALAARYPQARFVLIRRDPVRVLNSQFRNSFLYRARPEPYLQVLLAGIPLWKAAFGLMRVADKVLPDALYQRFLVEGLMRSLADQLQRHYAQLARVPSERYVEVHYEALIADPAAALARLGRFLDLPERPHAGTLAPSPRLEPLLDAVARSQGDFRRRLQSLPTDAYERGDFSGSPPR